MPYDLGVPFFPDSLNIPKDNPMTVDGVRLGRYLFYDGRLSGNPDKPMSCATCHKQKHSFECGMEQFPDGRPIGNSGKKTPNVMLPFVNLVWNNNGYQITGTNGKSIWLPAEGHLLPGAEEVSYKGYGCYCTSTSGTSFVFSSTASEFSIYLGDRAALSVRLVMN